MGHASCLHSFYHNVICTVAAHVAQAHCAQLLDILNASKFKGEGLSLVAMPRGNALFTLLRIITVCLHTVKIHVCMLWLTTIMQRPAMARRTIAIELLRRLDQLESDMRRSRSTPPPQPRSADAVHEDKQVMSRGSDCRGGRLNFRATHPQLTPHKPDGHAETTASRPDGSGSSNENGSKKLVTHDELTFCAKHNLVGTGSVQLYSSRDVWTDTSPRDLQNSNMLQTRARQIIRAVAAGAELTPPATPLKEATLAGLHHNAREHVASLQPGKRTLVVGNEGERIEASPFKDGHDKTWQYSPFDSDCTPLPADLGSPDSAITFTRGQCSLSPLSGTWSLSLNDDTVEGAEGSGIVSSDQTRVDVFDTVFGAVDEPRRPQYQRNDSVNSTKTTSVAFTTQSKANGGLLEFRAKATKPKGPNFARIHRRNVSIHLPIRPVSPGTQLSPPPPSTTSVMTPTCNSSHAGTHFEQELQYKHRHIFIGTASLHSFLEVLETSSPRTTSKLATMKAFTILASNEQILFRQTSSSTSDWNLVTRTTPDISTFDCITLARVQLGSVSLQLFVDLIPFNTRDEASIALVVEAFKNASHMDAEAGCNTRSKARAFRVWMMEGSDVVG
ncbi:hypothetical protein EKO04_006402 [Ascochyta lentis]|uniref:Uncharacterized protein n=1 Tax=Ascochyta lentis TaxID=205686 RepID=A0A8H7MD31_9PLEO|nr:hypothetical protein EKO04_006402 [Ascochyta lentis]